MTQDFSNYFEREKEPEPEITKEEIDDARRSFFFVGSSKSAKIKLLLLFIILTVIILLVINYFIDAGVVENIPAPLPAEF